MYHNSHRFKRRKSGIINIAGPSIFRPDKAAKEARGDVPIGTAHKGLRRLTQSGRKSGGPPYFRAFGWALSYTSINRSMLTWVYFWVVDREA